MCLATPMKIKEINGAKAVVESGSHSHIVDLSLVKNAKAGDYILAHGNMAINKVTEEDAEKILEMIKKLPHGH